MQPGDNRSCGRNGVSNSSQIKTLSADQPAVSWVDQQMVLFQKINPQDGEIHNSKQKGPGKITSLEMKVKDPLAPARDRLASRAK